MDFSLTVDQELLVESIQEFAERYFDEDTVNAMYENHGIPDEIGEAYRDAGFAFMGLPEECGGIPCDKLTLGLMTETLYHRTGCMTPFMTAMLATADVAEFGTPEQVSLVVDQYNKSGKPIASLALSEPGAGSDNKAMSTYTKRREDGTYIMNGQKTWVTNGGNTPYMLVVSKDEHPAHANESMSLWLIPTDAPGLSTVPLDKIGQQIIPFVDVFFDEVRLTDDMRLGKEGEGFKIAMSTLDGGRIGIAAQALGIAQGAFEHALSYSKERVQFGKPIAAQQSIAFKLADMATKLRCARFLIYSAAELKEQHAPYGMESAMAKMYASDIALEVTNDALQIHGGSGYLKGMEVERAYRDAKITTIYEGTNEIQRVVIASHLLGRLGKSSGGESRSAAKKPAPITGIRKKTIFREGDAAQQVADLVAALKKDGHDFSVGIPMDTPIPQAERVVSAGKGIGEKKNMKLVESLAKAAGAAIGSSRPVAETLKYLPLNRYVGMSGQKFTGNLYIACGISGASQHLKGIKDASTIVAINKNGNAPIFKNCDYGIVGDVEEILPLLTAALDSGEKLPAPPMVKMKRPTPPKPAPIGNRYVCSGCGYEYVPELGDEDGEIAPGTLFEQLPAEWVCPECAETKDQFVKA